MLTHESGYIIWAVSEIHNLPVDEKKKVFDKGPNVRVPQLNSQIINTEVNQK